MGEPRHGPRFAKQAPLPGLYVLARILVEQDLDGHSAVELGIERPIDHAHATGADALEDDITTDRRAAGEQRNLARASRTPGVGSRGRRIFRLLRHDRLPNP